MEQMSHDERQGQEVLGRRIAAALLDLLALVPVFVVLALTLGSHDTGGSSVNLSLSGGPALLLFGLALLYYFVLESWTAQTLGKRALGIRVVAGDGSAPTPGQIGLRTILRVVDILPALYLVGFVTCLATGRRCQRLGDLAGRTQVSRS